MKCLFRLLNIEVDWWIVDKHPEGGIYGCFESHLNIWEKYGTKKYLCVFEDDIELINGVDEFYHALSVVPSLDAKVISLGPSAVYVKEKLKNGFSRGFFLDLAAYIIPRKYLPDVIEHVKPHFGIHIDIAMLGLPTVARQIFRQNDSPSDNCHDSFMLLKKAREIAAFSLPGVGDLIVNYLILRRSNPKYREEEKIPPLIVDRRVAVSIIDNHSSHLSTS